MLNLSRGTLVRAIQYLDPEAADVLTGTLGVVFEEADYHKDGCGPLVRWFTGTVCNVYEGDVEVVQLVRSE